MWPTLVCIGTGELSIRRWPAGGRKSVCPENRSILTRERSVFRLVQGEVKPTFARSATVGNLRLNHERRLVDLTGIEPVTS